MVWYFGLFAMGWTWASGPESRDNDRSSVLFLHRPQPEINRTTLVACGGPSTSSLLGTQPARVLHTAEGLVGSCSGRCCAWPSPRSPPPRGSSRPVLSVDPYPSSLSKVNKKSHIQPSSLRISACLSAVGLSSGEPGLQAHVAVQRSRVGRSHRRDLDYLMSLSGEHRYLSR